MHWPAMSSVLDRHFNTAGDVTVSICLACCQMQSRRNMTQPFLGRNRQASITEHFRAVLLNGQGQSPALGLGHPLEQLSLTCAVLS
jgi:hypothetical protein